MLGQTELIASKLQSIIGKLLQNKERLNALSNDQNITVRVAAQDLMVKQNEIEGYMYDIMPAINRIKAGEYTLNDITTVTPFFYQAYQHNDDVDSLQNESMGIEGGGMNNKIIFALLALGGLFLFIRRR